MVGRNPAALGDMVAKGLRRAGRRGVVVTGAGGIEIAPSDDICVIEEAPHWWLMPRTAAAVTFCPSAKGSLTATTSVIPAQAGTARTNTRNTDRSLSIYRTSTFSLIIGYI